MWTKMAFCQWRTSLAPLTSFFVSYLDGKDVGSAMRPGTIFGWLQSSWNPFSKAILNMSHQWHHSRCLVLASLLVRQLNAGSFLAPEVLSVEFFIEGSKRRFAAISALSLFLLAVFAAIFRAALMVSNAASSELGATPALPSKERLVQPL